ncbi:sensor histidine kinase [Ancylomarina salipaludis]|uniref:Sensor histidine kinase n=1 Tax=Ancylomarina salipaludis TaxID=2501299 RepID=A0A4Q1JNW2_9BACT|nr:sensor histidine kinase [Ancylomarina salipaludis]RXQ95781.1 sensor histidine kinase [Ancylomarina salipaludis]
MLSKKNFHTKQKVISVLLLFSFFAFAGIIYTFRISSIIDARHIKLVEYSENVEVEVFNGRIQMDDGLIQKDSLAYIGIKKSFDKAILYVNRLAEIANKTKRDVPDSNQIFEQKLSETKTSIEHLEQLIMSGHYHKRQSLDSTMLRAYLDFNRIFTEYEKTLQNYINESNSRLKKKIFLLLGAIFVILLVSLLLIARLMDSLMKADRQILSNTMDVEQRERRRIAMDLHDGLGAILSSVGMYSKILEKELIDNKHAGEKLKHITNLSNQALQAVGEIINNLNPSILNRYNIVESLEKLCAKMNSIGKMTVEFDSSQFSGEMTKSKEVMLYRISGELLNNSLKHANADHATIKLSRIRSHVILSYHDNGVGFEISKLAMHGNDKMGLSNIVERVESIGGHCVLESSPGNGFTIKIEFN